MSKLVLPEGAIERNRILVVDDEPRLLETYGRELGRVGLRHMLLDSELSALTELAESKYTGVLTDGLNGGWQNIFEEAERLKTNTALITADDQLVEQVISTGRLAFDKTEPSFFEQAVLAILI